MILVQITGAPASGKTTGGKSLDSKKTYWIDADEKGLSWKGWRTAYNTNNKNYAAISDPTKIYQVVKAVAETRPDINCIVIDTINTIMSNEEMDILKNPSRDAWKDLAGDIFDLYKLIRQMKGRDDLVVFVMAHPEPYEVNGITKWRTMTNGKKLSKLNLNGLLRYNLYTQVDQKPDGTTDYKLSTEGKGITEARAVMGVFPPVIPNDLEAVRKAIVEAEHE